MRGFRLWLLESPARYRCAVCGGLLVVFHLCSGCLQTVHPECAGRCHAVQVRVEPQECLVGLNGLPVCEEETPWL